jgi:hypothetical protein
MSYLIQYATRGADAVVAKRRGVRVDERARLNLPGYFGDAYVHVFVEDTTGRNVRPRRRKRPLLPVPRTVLEVADCSNSIHLEFALHTDGHRANALHKIDTLVGALQRFRDALVAEAELAALREHNT